MSIYYEGKPCRRCGNTKRYKSTRACIPCTKMHTDARLTPELNTKYALKRKYNMTVEERDVLVKEHDGKCAICESAVKLNIDHDHATGKVRGLLCHSCNVSLGHFRDDVQLLEKAITYLRSSQE